MKVELVNSSGNFGWLEIAGKYATGYAGGISTTFGLTEAKNNCLNNRLCTAISCNTDKSNCTMSS
jgi:hypothetical protein